MRYLIVKPYTDKPDRLLTATVVRSFDTAAEAFAGIDGIAEQLRREDLRTDVIERIVVDELRRPVQPDEGD